MKLKKKHLEQQLTNLRDRIPLQNNSCKSEDISFLSLLYLIMVQTFGTILLFLYTLINFCTIILSLVKFFLGWLINLLKTPTKSSILIKSVVILLEFIALMVIVYKIASVVFVPIIGVQLTVANQLVWGGASSEEEEEEEGRGLWFSGGDTREDTGEEGKAGEESMKVTPNRRIYEEDYTPYQEPFSKEKEIEEDMKIEGDTIQQVVKEEFYSEHILDDKSLIKINCGAEAFNSTHIKRKVIIFKEGMNIRDVRLLCNS